MFVLPWSVLESILGFVLGLEYLFTPLPRSFLRHHSLGRGASFLELNMDGFHLPGVFVHLLLAAFNVIHGLDNRSSSFKHFFDLLHYLSSYFFILNSRPQRWQRRRLNV